jgi:hypothetical protein
MFEHFVPAVSHWAAASLTPGLCWLCQAQKALEAPTSSTLAGKQHLPEVLVTRMVLVVDGNSRDQTVHKGMCEPVWGFPRDTCV